MKHRIPKYIVLTIITIFICRYLPLLASDKNFSINYYILMENKPSKYLKEYQFIYVGLKLKSDGRFAKTKTNFLNSNKINKLLITHGGSKPIDWGKEEFKDNFHKSIVRLKNDQPDLEEIQLDFEGFSSSDKHQFAKFACDMKKRINQEGIQLALALFPPIHPDNKGFHDWKLLKDCANRFYVMMYDMHSPRTIPGQVSNSDWIEKNLQLIEDQIGSSKKDFYSKLTLGLPLYGYSWNKSGKYLRVYPNRNIKAVEEAGMQGVVWKRSENETVYMPSNQFLRYWKLEAQKRGMNGVVYWRWGY